MKDKIEINDGNYEDVMAGLLEHHFSEEEKEEILFDIARDPFLQFEWKQFQKCVVKEDLQPYEIEEIEFWKSLQQREEEVKPVTKKRVVIAWFQLSVAASIALLAGVLYYLLLPGVQNDTAPTIVKADIEMKKDAPPVKNETNQKPVLSSSVTKSKKKFPSPIINSNPLSEQQGEISPASYDKIVINEPTTETVTIPLPKIAKRYTVNISSESISENDFALLDDYDIQKVSEEDLNRINNTLKSRQTTLTQLLKNTKVQLKQKNNKIYLMASGDHQSTYILEIAN